MLRIATWYESRLGRNDGNPLYVTAALKRIQFYIALASGRPAGLDMSPSQGFPDGKEDPEAKKLAQEIWDQHHELIEVDHFYPTGEIKPFGTYDLNIWTDWGEDALEPILPYKVLLPPRPWAYWASDTHIKTSTVDSYDYRCAMAKKADFVFCAQKNAVERMAADGVAHPIWLPHAVEPLAYPKIDLAAKRRDVCFVGHVNSQNRTDALDRLFREFPSFYYGQQLFEKAAEKFCESRIVFNIAMTDDINMRCFEALSTGSFLLTNWIPTIEEIFEDGKHLVLYRSLDEMIEKARYYLDHEDEREKIAQAGFELVRSKHTILHRVKTMLDNSLFAKKSELVNVQGVKG